MLRYQQQFAFFDAAKVGDGSVRFVHLGQVALEGGMAKVLEAIVQEVETSSPGIVVVDSFRAMVRSTLAAGPGGERELTDFMQRLALALTSYEATTFLIGEYADGEHDSAVFTVADGLVWLYQAVDRNSVVRKLQVVKMRGQGQIPGLHTARITDAGYSVFPRLLKPVEIISDHPLKHRLSTGVKGLDEMMGGGVPSGYSVLIAGPSGSGKTVLSNQFIIEGAERGENGVVAIFEKRPNDYLQTTPRGEAFEKLVREKKLEVVYLRPLDLSIDETLLELRNAVKRLGAKRAVIDSLSGLELALAPTFREDFRESLYRMMGALTGLGVTVMATVEMADSYTDLRFSSQGIAFLTDAIIIQRYVEIDGQLKRALAVIKVRSSQHSKELREYEVSPDGGIVVGNALKGYEGLLTGTPKVGEPGK
jgi:circadian clock protein KaiC